MAPVADQRRHHDPGGERRLEILLADQQQELADQPLRRLRVVRAEDRADEVEHPLVARLAEGRLTGDVDDPQRLEHRQRRFRLVREQRRARHQAAPLDDPLLPVGAGGRPLQGIT
jgi:DNA-binding TFAR19-related protein (PDSD5 family)